jgi:hypothetical protein
MKKTGLALIVVSTLLLLGGTVGYTVEGTVDDVPTPNVQGLVFFSDDALPGNPASLVINADTNIKWDRDDVFLVIADGGKKKKMAVFSADLTPTARPVHMVMKVTWPLVMTKSKALIGELNRANSSQELEQKKACFQKELNSTSIIQSTSP